MTDPEFTSRDIGNATVRRHANAAWKRLRTEDRAASIRLLLPHPNHWTVSEAHEARTCTGCTVRYDQDIRIVTVVQGCPAHTSGKS